MREGARARPPAATRAVLRTAAAEQGRREQGQLVRLSGSTKRSTRERNSPQAARNGVVERRRYPGGRPPGRPGRCFQLRVAAQPARARRRVPAAGERTLIRITRRQNRDLGGLRRRARPGQAAGRQRCDGVLMNSELPAPRCSGARATPSPPTVRNRCKSMVGHIVTKRAHGAGSSPAALTARPCGLLRHGRYVSRK